MLFDSAVGQLAELSSKAAAKLGELLDNESPGVAFQAAQSILENGPKLRDSTDLAQRVAELERQRKVDKK
jgi:hypothetical protein